MTNSLVITYIIIKQNQLKSLVISLSLLQKRTVKAKLRQPGRSIVVTNIGSGPPFTLFRYLLLYCSLFTDL